MRQTKTRMELFSFYDHRGIAAHLEDQARKGWLLEKIGTWGWKYRRIEPKDLQFAVTYYPKASPYDPGPSEQERTLQAYCEEAGWTLAASNAQMQVFYHETPDPVPLETDAAVQVENIHAAAKRSHLPSQWLLGGLGVLQMVMWLVELFENPVALLSDYGGLFRCVCWLNLILLCAVELVSYYRWHKKAVQAAEESGILYPTRSHRSFQAVCLASTIGSLLAYMALLQSKRVMTILLLTYVYMILMFLGVNGCRMLLKKLQVSTGTNRIVTLIVDVVLAFAMMGLLTWGVMKIDVQDREPVDTYEKYGLIREVYADELPLSVEDLVNADPAGYSKVLEVQETFLAAVYDGDQDSRGDWEVEQPDLSYRLAVSKIPVLTKWFWNGWIEDYRGVLVEIDPTPWRAAEAYRVYSGGEPGYTWYVRWEDRFVRLTAYWELTADQMAVIGEKLHAVSCA